MSLIFKSKSLHLLVCAISANGLILSLGTISESSAFQANNHGLKFENTQLSIQAMCSFTCWTPWPIGFLYFTSLFKSGKIQSPQCHARFYFQFLRSIFASIELHPISPRPLFVFLLNEDIDHDTMILSFVNIQWSCSWWFYSHMFARFSYLLAFVLIMSVLASSEWISAGVGCGRPELRFANCSLRHLRILSVLRLLLSVPIMLEFRSMYPLWV